MNFTPCNDFKQTMKQRGPSRREFLQVGALGALGLSLGDALRLQAAPAVDGVDAVEGKAKAVIHLFLPGGMAAQESWDPKPYAPIEYRGPMGNIKTKIDGERFGQMMKQCATVADKMTVIRSMTHGEAAHERGTHNMFTGYKPSPALSFPSFGSIISHEFGPRGAMPPYVCIPNPANVFAQSGYLSSAYGPFGLGADPNQAGFKVRDLNLPGGVTPEHFAKRRKMLGVVDHHFMNMEESDALDSMDTFYKRAYSMISSPEAREAFNMEKEPQALKDKYGKTQAGQRMLLARRLVEGGVRFVSLTAGGWDHHNNIKGAFESNMPPVDQAIAALLRDLEERGMLDSTLVMVSSEFGRTPKINANAGRDHYPKVFSVMLAGGGITKGQVYGTSDATSTAPDENPVSVENLAATVYKQLGIDHRRRLMAPGDRPIDIVRGGEAIDAIIA